LIKNHALKATNKLTNILQVVKLLKKQMQLQKLQIGWNQSKNGQLSFSKLSGKVVLAEESQE